MKILVTGGGGYIGSFMAKRLLDDGHQVVVVDNFDRGYKSVVDKRAILKVGNLCDRKFVSSIFEGNQFDGVIHFAAFISVAESVENPHLYFFNNIQASLNIIEEMNVRGQNNFIFSSTAGVYGNPTQIPIPEDHSKNPESPYGESKLIVEKILSWYLKTKNFSYVVLRYFNAAGAALDGNMGEQHKPESHIIPNVISAALKGKSFKLFGNDYKTQDGTCVRDYIHVLDLVDAHLLALEKLKKTPGGFTYNVGTGQGHSNKDIVEKVRQISKIDLTTEYAPRRAGDPALLVADSTRIRKELKFEPRYSDLDTIVRSAWKWYSLQGKTYLP